MKTQHGVGLVELIVAIVIALVLVLGLAQTFATMSSTSPTPCCVFIAV